jgi:autotransporter-associated beta strand protein
VASPPAGYYEVWGDEFQESSLNTSDWVYWLYPGTYKDATLSQSAVSVSGDHGVITTYTSGGTDYTAMLSTQGKFHFRYGYIEANIQWGDSLGMWSAFWLQSPLMGSYIGDPATAGAEIDICEHRLEDGSGNNINNYVQSNLHWNGYGSSAASAGSGNFTDSGTDLGSGFHKYGLLWTSSGYTVYVNDGQQKWTSSSGLSAHTEFVILSSIVDDTDTTWAGSIPSGGYGSLSSSSAKLAVDYVRYYAPDNTIFWIGNSSPNWFDTNNWIAYTNAPASGNDVVFSMLSSGNFNTTLDQALTINSLSIWETSAVTINGNTLTINGGGIDLNSAYNDLTINSDVIFGNGNHWTIGSGHTINANGHLSGGHSLSLDGYGTAALNNSNSYTLGTYINRGTLRLLNASALGATNVGTTVASGGQLQVYSSLACNQPLTLNGTGTSANGALRVSANAGAMWTGLITLGSAASIKLDGGTSFNPAGGVNLGGYALTIMGDSGSSGTIPGGVSGSGSLIKDGADTWYLTASNSFTGPVSVSAGFLRVTDNNALGAGGKTITSATRTGALELDGGVTLPANYTLALSGDGSAANGATVSYALHGVTGTNTVTGAICMTSGAGHPVVSVDAGGVLNLNGIITNDTARTLILSGSGTGNINGGLADGVGQSSLQVNGGTWRLNTANTFSGSTTNLGGTLALGPAGSLSNSPNIFVTNAALLDVSQIAGGLVLNNAQTLTGNGAVTGSVMCASGAMLSPGAGIGTLSFSNNLALAGNATCLFDLVNLAAEGGGTNDEILVAGDLNLAGTNSLSINPVVGTLASGRYTLLRYGGALNGGATNFTVVFTGVPPQAALALDFSVTNQIGLVVSAFPGNLVWQGDGAANLWNSGLSSDWYNGTALTVFSPGDSVTFDDTSTNTTVNLSGAVAPGLITINGAGNYTFAGGGKIAGITGLIKNSSGVLTVLTTNAYTGATEINAGTVQVGNGTNAGSLGSGNLINDGALIYNHADTETNSGIISGTGPLTKLGAGTLNLNGNNSFAGGVTLSQGTLVAGTGSALGAGPVAILNSATQLVCGAGITLSNSFTISPGASSGVFASGIIKGPATGFATLAGAVTITASTGSGGHFDGGNATNGLVFNGPITASVPVRHRANRATFGGGGNYTFFLSEGTTVLGANNGLATNAVADLGYSGSAGTLDLAGFNQTLNGLVKGSQAATVGNSSTNRDSVLVVSGVASNTTYAGAIQDALSNGTRKVFLTVGGGTFTLSAANTFSGDTEPAGGTLLLGSATALQDSPLNLAGGDTGVISFGSLTSATVGGVKGQRNLALTNSSGAAVALTVGNGNTNTYAYSGSLTGGGSVTKASAGTWILNGTNTFAGVLYVDTAQPSSGNDGILDLAAPTALSGASSISIRNQNAATSMLELDGTAGNLSLAQPVSLNGRNPASVAIDNVAGSNTLAGNVSFGSGGTNYYFESDGGTLVFGGAVGMHSLSSPRLLVFQGNGNFLVSGFITNAAATNANYVAKNGPGTLTLAGTNLYLGTTTINGGTLLVNGVISTNTVMVAGGTLGGGGLIRGPVAIQAGGVISPGAINGTASQLTISNTLVLSGTAFLALNAATGTNDVVRGMTSVTYGGSLLLTNLAGALNASNAFKLFSAAAYNGAFANISPAVPAPGLAWNTNTLAADGTLRIVQTVSLVPTNVNFQITGNQLTLSWPTNYIGWRLQAQTNGTGAGLGTNWTDVSGASTTNSMTFTVDPGNGTVFYRMVFP